MNLFSEEFKNNEQEQTTPQFTTTLKKGREGWNAKTMVKFNGYDWNISTYKGNRGTLKTWAQGGTEEKKEGYTTFSFTMFQDPNIDLNTVTARCTEKSISIAHAEGLKVFQNKMQSGELPSK